MKNSTNFFLKFVELFTNDELKARGMKQDNDLFRLK